MHKQPLSITAAAAPFQTSQASTSAPRHQPASTFSTAPSPAHPVKLRAHTTAPASGPGPPQPQPQAPHPAGQSALPQGLVLTSQAQARLPSKWPCCASCTSSPEKLYSDQLCVKSLCCPLPFSSPLPECCLSLRPASRPACPLGPLCPCVSTLLASCARTHSAWCPGLTCSH